MASFNFYNHFLLTIDSKIYLIDYRVKKIKPIIRFFRILLFAFMFAVCMVMGIAPVIPKRNEEFEIEIKVTDTESKEETDKKTAFYKADR